MPDDLITHAVDELTYGMYRRNRDMGIAAERMYCVFGEVPVESMEARYRKEKANG
jgi:hypothetical protein